MYTENWMTKKSSLENEIKVVWESLVLRYVNSATKFAEKNPTENGKFLSIIFIGCLLQFPKKSS